MEVTNIIFHIFKKLFIGLIKNVLQIYTMPVSEIVALTLVQKIGHTVHS